MVRFGTVAIRGAGVALALAFACWLVIAATYRLLRPRKYGDDVALRAY